MTSISIRLILQRETKGALRYQEVDSNDQPVLMHDPNTVVGTLYLRKQGLPTGTWPSEIRVTIKS